MRKKLMLGIAGIGAAAALTAAPASAQISYYTQGYFTSPSFAPCNQSAPALGAAAGATCTGGGFTLTYTPVTYTTPLASGTIASLGQFTLSGSGEVTVPAGVLDFTVLVQQTSPTVGTGTFVGAITGTVSTSPYLSSTLMWTPNQTATVGPVTYTMVWDNIGPAANIGIGIPVSQTNGINVMPTTVPEPGSMALLATGLIGVLGGAVRSRRKSKV